MTRLGISIGFCSFLFNFLLGVYVIQVPCFTLLGSVLAEIGSTPKDMEGNSNTRKEGVEPNDELEQMEVDKAEPGTSTEGSAVNKPEKEDTSQAAESDTKEGDMEEGTTGTGNENVATTNGKEVTMETQKETTEKTDMNVDADSKEAEDDDKEDSDDGESIENDEKKYKNFPTTLEGFGYRFNEAGELRNIDTNERFEFRIDQDDQLYNQKRYEAIGEIITEYVYELLESQTKLKKVFVPIDAPPEEHRSFIFMTEDAMEADKLLVLIHGSGVVRAGQWARRLIINDNLAMGTQIPYIERAIKEGYGVMVLNTNENYKMIDNKREPIRENSSPEDHAQYVWKNFVETSKAKHIAIVAHSYGGMVTVELSVQNDDSFKDKVFAIAFTDSVHSLAHQEVPESTVDFYEKHAQNWVSSNRRIDEPMPSYRRRDCPRVSAGHERHEMTSWSSMESIFKFLENKLTEVKQKTDDMKIDKESPADGAGDSETNNAKDEL